MTEELTRAARSLNCKCTGRRAALVWQTQDNPHNHNQFWFTLNRLSRKQATRAEHRMCFFDIIAFVRFFVSWHINLVAVPIQFTIYLIISINIKIQLQWLICVRFFTFPAVQELLL